MPQQISIFQLENHINSRLLWNIIWDVVCLINRNIIVLCADQDSNCRYLETLMHLFKGNVGSGIFAMGDAMKNAGILVGPIATLILGIICVHCQHLLVSRKFWMVNYLMNINLFSTSPYH